MSASHLTFKIADRPDEIEQVHRLNYETFVEEIPQHHHNPDRRLVDKFHDENTYLIARSGDEVIGMIAARGNRPFSLDQKLENLDSYLPPHSSICEFRLLAVRSAFRGGQVLPGLMHLLNLYCIDHGHDLGIISGTTRQQRLYAHLGFRPFGPLVGTGEATFQPMFLTVDAADRLSRPLLRLNRRRPASELRTSFLPGPVAIAPEVRSAFAALPVSHRCREFRDLFQRTSRRLCHLTAAANVTIMSGSGTTANDAVAAHLRTLGGHGLILTNGEFGERLLDHATRTGLQFDCISASWGEALDYERIDQAIRENHPDWIWSVHCETSTGTLNKIDRLKSMAEGGNARLILDCIGSIGTVPLDLRGVFAATATSGKGLASYAGIAMIFLDHVPEPNPNIARSIDLGLFASECGVPFTLLSNHLAAVDSSLVRLEAPSHYDRIVTLGQRVRRSLEGAGFVIVGEDDNSSPAVITIALDDAISSIELGDALEAAGYLTSYLSAYLQERNWLQVCLMGDVRDQDLDGLLATIPRLAGEISRRDESQSLRVIG